jgi:hypothetical protein
MAKKTAKKKTVKRPAAKKKAAKKASAPVAARRSDFGAPVTTYFESLSPAQRDIARAAHRQLMNAAPTLESAVKWGIAQYTFPGMSMKDAEGFAIYATSKSVNLAIGRGGELSKAHPLLEGTGKSMRHVKLTSVEQANSPAVAAIVKDAVALTSAGG